MKNIINFKRKKNVVIISKGLSWFTVSYVSLLSEKFNRLNNEDIRISFYNFNKLRKFIKVHKDPLPHEKKSNVYKIYCKDCDASYVKQTGRQLKTRIVKHRNHSVEYGSYDHTFGHKWPPIGRGSWVRLRKHCNLRNSNIERDWCRTCYTSGDKHVAQPADEFGGVSQDLLSNYRRTIGALPINHSSLHLD